MVVFAGVVVGSEMADGSAASTVAAVVQQFEVVVHGAEFLQVLDLMV